MSVDIIGNGNLPCVYTKNIYIEEKEELLIVSNLIYDFINSNGDPMWTDFGFLNNEVYVYSVVLYNINEIVDIQSILLNNSELVQKIKLGDVIKSNLSLSEIQTTGLQQQVMTNSNVVYSTEFTHKLDLSGDLHIVSFIAYDIEAQANVSVMDADKKFFIGPMLIDTVKESSLGTSEYVQASETFLKDAELYKGSFHAMQNGKKMSGVVHDNNSVDLKILENNYNTKVAVIRNYDQIYKRQEIDYGNLELELKDFISKPLLSIGGQTTQSIRFYVKVDPITTGLVLNSSILARYNYLKIVDNLKVQCFLTGTADDELEITLQQAPDQFSETGDILFRNIRINHSPNSRDMFFETVAYIPPIYQTMKTSFKLLVRLVNSQQSGEEILNSFFTKNPDTVVSNFLQVNTTDTYKKDFVKNLLIALSLKYDMIQEDIKKETLLLISGLKGSHSELYKQRLANIFVETYLSLRADFSAIQPSINTNEIEFETEVIDLNNFFKNKAQRYIPNYGERDTNESYTFFSYGNLVSVVDLQRVLEEQNRYIDPNKPLAILQGRQQLAPWGFGEDSGFGAIRNFYEKLTSDSENFFTALDYGNLDYYTYQTSQGSTGPTPTFIYTDEFITKTVENFSPEEEEGTLSLTTTFTNFTEGVENESVDFIQEEQQVQTNTTLQNFSFNTTLYTPRTFYSYN